MHRHILLPTDGSELSEQAVNYGVALAEVVSAKERGLPSQLPSTSWRSSRTWLRTR